MREYLLRLSDLVQRGEIDTAAKDLVESARPENAIRFVHGLSRGAPDGPDDSRRLSLLLLANQRNSWYAADLHSLVDHTTESIREKVARSTLSANMSETPTSPVFTV